MKTIDGVQAEVGKHYYNEYGEEVILNRVVVDPDNNNAWFLVTPLYEGETIEAKLYPTGHTEISAPYEHEGEPRLVNAIWAEEPDPRLGPKYKRAMSELRSIAITVGDLKGEKNRLLEENRDIIRKREEVAEKFVDANKCLAKKHEELLSLSEKVDEKRQRLGELEDSLS